MRKHARAATSAGVATMAVVLPAFWSMMQVRRWWDVPIDAVVYAVVLAIAVPRGLDRIRPDERPAAWAALGAGTLGATGCGMLLGFGDGRRALGAACFALCVALPVALRRRGPRWRAAGILGTLPFTAILIHPVPLGRSWAFVVWMLLATAVAGLWSQAFQASRGSADAGRVQEPTAARGRRRVPAHARLAIQLAVATSAAFAAAQYLDADHPVWPVLTVLVVHSGNRGRGDVLWKGFQRVVGVLVGTVVATVAAGTLRPHDGTAVVVLFVVLAVASALRRIGGHGFWAAGVTAALAYLYGYFGQTGTDLLTRRLEGVLVGGAVAVLAAWLVLPVRTTDAVRVRLSRHLAAVTDLATALARGTAVAGPSSRLRDADRELVLLEPTARAARHLGFGSARRLAAAIGRARALGHGLLAYVQDGAVRPDADRPAFGALAREAGAARGSLAAGRPHNGNAPTAGPVAALVQDARAITELRLAPQRRRERHRGEGRLRSPGPTRR